MEHILSKIQSELKCPKGQMNKFGGYKYRSLEDILEAAKPVLAANAAAIILADTIELIGERYYIKATAKLVDADGKTIAENSAYAREPQNKKGMDEAQITGATSSYARKYALNGLFAIDDTKDDDTDEHQKESVSRAKRSPELYHYDIATVEDGKREKAETYLRDNGAEQVVATLWESKKELTNLEKYRVSKASAMERADHYGDRR